MTEKEKNIEREMKEILEWAKKEREKLDEKYKNEYSLDGHSSEYKAITSEQVRRIQDLKKNMESW